MNPPRSYLPVAGLVWLIAATPSELHAAHNPPTGCEPAGVHPSVTNAGRPAGLPRIRPASVQLAVLLLDGLRQSQTLRALVEKLQSRDAIVYLYMLPAAGDRIGSLQWIANAGGLRYLQATVVAAGSSRAMIAAMGHELEHAMEVAETTSVTDLASFTAFYRSIGERAHGVQGAWETQRAYEVGERIKRELALPAHSARPPLRLTHPTEWIAIYGCHQPAWSSPE